MGCLVVSLFVFEVLVRCFAPHPCYEEPMWIDVNTGYLMRPNFHGRATNMFGEFDTLIEINREGFRDFNHPLQKAPHTLRIAFLGDSFTCGEQVEENEVFVRRVGESLHGTLHRPVECLNFGIGGYDTQQEVLCYESFVRKYHPDVVVLEMYPRNDIIGNIFYETEQNFGRPYYRFQEDRLVKVAADPVKLQRNYETEKRHLGVRWYHHLQGYNAFKHLRWEILKYWDRYWVTKHPPSLTDLHREAWYESLRYYEIPSDAFVQRAEKATQLLLERLEREIRLDGGLFFIAIFPSYSSLWPERWPDRRQGTQFRVVPTQPPRAGGHNLR